MPEITPAANAMSSGFDVSDMWILSLRPHCFEYSTEFILFQSFSPNKLFKMGFGPCFPFAFRRYRLAALESITSFLPFFPPGFSSQRYPFITDAGNAAGIVVEQVGRNFPPRTKCHAILRLSTAPFKRPFLRMIRDMALKNGSIQALTGLLSPSRRPSSAVSVGTCSQASNGLNRSYWGLMPRFFSPLIFTNQTLARRGLEVYAKVMA